jgi:hypothetical protein
MRSATGPALVVIGLAVAVVLVLVLLQTIGLRSDLRSSREEVKTLQAKVDGLERGVPMSQLSLRMTELENDIRDWVVAFSSDIPAGSGDPSSPAGGSSSEDEVLERVDEVLARIEALDRRLDEICEGVPVC